MYTVGRDMLPEADRTAEAVELMIETLAEVKEMPFTRGLMFSGEVLRDTEDPDAFKVESYCGRIIGASTIEPPTFTLAVDEAWVSIGECDCPEADLDIVFDDFEQAMAETQLSIELDELAGVETQDPHLEPLPITLGEEIDIRFDRLGWYGCSGAIGPAPKA